MLLEQQEAKNLSNNLLFFEEYLCEQDLIPADVAHSRYAFKLRNKLPFFNYLGVLHYKRKHAISSYFLCIDIGVPKILIRKDKYQGYCILTRRMTVYAHKLDVFLFDDVRKKALAQ